jgi:putative redox protein
VVDEPAGDGGLGSGPNPYDLLSAALGACTTMTLSLYAGLKGFPLQRAEVCVVHRRIAPDGPNVFTRTMYLEGPLSVAQTARLLDVAKRCPVHRTLERSSEIRTELASGLKGDKAITPVSAHRDAMRAAAN